MRIISCRIENFGKFCNASFSFEQGCNVCCEGNGWGKSTLSAFIKVMFFGFENEKKRDALENERKRYKPWQGGVYGGQLTFEAGGKTYIISRTFGTKESEDVFALRDANTNLLSDDFSERIGEELFQIDCNSFCRTVFLSQNDCQTDTTDRINAKLGNLAEHTDDINNFEKVNQRFADLLNRMSPTRKTGMLAKQKEEIEGLKVLEKEAVAVEQAMQEVKERQQKNQEEKVQLEQTREQLLIKQKKLSALKDIQLLQQRYESLCSDFEERKQAMEECRSGFGDRLPKEQELEEKIKDSMRLLQERERAAVYELTQEEQEKLCELSKRMEGDYKNGAQLKGGLSVIVPGILLVLTGVFAFLWQAIVGALLLGVGVLWLAVGLYRMHITRLKKEYAKKTEQEVWNRLTEKKSRFDVTEAECRKLEASIEAYLSELSIVPKQPLNEQLFALQKRWKEYRNCVLEYEKAKEAKEAFERDADMEYVRQSVSDDKESMESVNAQLNEILSRLEQIQNRILEDNRALEELQSRMDELSEEEDRRKLLEEEYHQELKKYKLLTQTKAFLEEAKSTFTAKYMEPITNGFYKYYGMLVPTEEERPYHLDADTHLSVDELGMQREIRFLSAGRKDLLGICMRMALIDVMYQKEKPFIIFDDPFVNLDSEKTKGARKLLEHIATEYQVLYFTCHESRR